MQPDYASAPNGSGDSLKRYFENRIKPGSFLEAVLANDFVQAGLAADFINQRLMSEYAQWLLMNIVGRDPYMFGFGSWDNVRKWLEGDDV